MIEIEFELEIARPVAEVFEYVAVPERLPEWQGTAEIVRDTPGPIEAGSRFRAIHRTLGKRIEALSEVKVYEPSRRFDALVAAGPIPMNARWDFEPTDSGTLLRFSAHGQVSGVLRLAEPIAGAMLGRRIRGEHEQLKRLLESRPSA